MRLKPAPSSSHHFNNQRLKTTVKRCPAKQLRAAGHLFIVRKMKFSVIIPAYNEAQYIEPVIEVLKKQTVPRKDFEIIVVDNNSGDNTAEIAKKAGADKVVKEIKQGTNMARQRGAEESRGEILVFLDADTLPPPDWLEKIKKNLDRSGVAAVSGPYDYGFKGIKKIANKIYTNFLMPLTPKILYFFFRKKAGVILGGNFAMPRSTFRKIGKLPPLEFFGDEAAIAMLVSRNVGKVIFDPTLAVKSSPRRFQKYGLLSTISKYVYHYLKIYFSRAFDRIKE